MKKLLLLTLLCFSINGFAFNWKKVDWADWIVDFGNSYYVDIDNIKKHNGLVYYWTLVDLLEPNKQGAYSFIAKHKVNCVEEKQTWLSITFYSQSMGKGTILNESNLNEIQYPKPNTIGYDVLKFACDYAK